MKVPGCENEDFAKSLRNFIHNFWKDCFRKPKLL